MSRIIRLLDPPTLPALTRRQIAQRKYRQSAKGRAAHARSETRRKAKWGPEHQAKKTARNRVYRLAKPDHWRAYHRVYQRRWRRENAPQQVA